MTKIIQRSQTYAGLVTFGLAGLAIALTAIFFHLGRQPDMNVHVPEFIELSLLASVFYLIGVYWVEKCRLGPGALTIILTGAVLFRVLLLPAQPSLSDDVYRYQWDGRVQRAHLNPYKVFPALPQLAWLQNSEHPLESGRTTPTVYPPLSEMAYRLVTTVPGYKRLFTTFDLASIGVLLLLLSSLKQPLHRVLVYAWNPTVIVSFAMSGHHDSLAIFTFLIALLFLVANRPSLSIASLALSFLAKFFSVLLLPVFLKRMRLAYAGIFAVFVVLAYLPYFGPGVHVFTGLSNYAKGWENNDSLFRLLHVAVHSKREAEFVAGVLALGLVAYVLKKRMEPLRASLLLTAGIVLLSPNAFPWYFTWSIPFLCFYPSAPWLLMSVTSVLGYAPVVAYAAGQPYKDSPGILVIEYAPVYIWLIWRGCRPVMRRYFAKNLDSRS